MRSSGSSGSEGCVAKRHPAVSRVLNRAQIMAIPLQADRRAGEESNEELLRTISTRVGGTRATAVQPRVRSVSLSCAGGL